MVSMLSRVSSLAAQGSCNIDQDFPGLNDRHERGNECGANPPDHRQDNPEDEVACIHGEV